MIYSKTFVIDSIHKKKRKSQQSALFSKLVVASIDTQFGFFYHSHQLSHTHTNQCIDCLMDFVFPVCSQKTLVTYQKKRKRNYWYFKFSSRKKCQHLWFWIPDFMFECKCWRDVRGQPVLYRNKAIMLWLGGVVFQHYQWYGLLLTTALVRLKWG